MTAEELSTGMQQGTGSGSRLLLLEACYGATRPAAFIPGAVLVHMEEIDVCEEMASGGPVRFSGNYSLSLQKLKATVEAIGADVRTMVVVYTQSFKAGVADPIVAARLAWALAFAGVEHVALLGGGMHAWLDAGLAVATQPAARPAQPTDFFAGGPTDFPRNPHFLAETHDVRLVLAAADAADAANTDSRAVLADVRSWREFVGEGHDYPFALPHGRIPTARWAHWGPSTYVGCDFFSPLTGALLPISHVRELWHCPREGILGSSAGCACADEGLRAPRRIIFYCGSGWRSSLAWCLARLMGVDDCSNYDGGFLEWSMLDPEAERHPIARGYGGGKGGDGEAAVSSAVRCTQ